MFRFACSLASRVSREKLDCKHESLEQQQPMCGEDWRAYSQGFEKGWENDLITIFVCIIKAADWQKIGRPSWRPCNSHRRPGFNWRLRYELYVFCASKAWLMQKAEIYNKIEHFGQVERSPAKLLVDMPFEGCGPGKAEVREKKLKLLMPCCVRLQKEEGIVPGSGVALPIILEGAGQIANPNSDQEDGVQIMAAYLIASNAGVDGSVIDKLLEQDSSDLGYNPARGNYVDMFKCGDVDPLKHVPSEFAKATSEMVEK
ncbi:hypothetical protein CUMW_265090 [Citrus unshiu]|uniref:Uncharacterized protein n=1 Tax=Citrus unshiu TaxID=55188 RepID=A0A2H5QVA9_CITUN|nr:hypothetical protein CUMW_265090 [Citrus unshiu]